jgi:hypothetical protein
LWAALLSGWASKVSRLFLTGVDEISRGQWTVIGEEVLAWPIGEKEGTFPISNWCWLGEIGWLERSVVWEENLATLNWDWLNNLTNVWSLQLTLVNSDAWAGSWPLAQVDGVGLC